MISCVIQYAISCTICDTNTVYMLLTCVTRKTVLTTCSTSLYGTSLSTFHRLRGLQIWKYSDAFSSSSFIERSCNLRRDFSLCSLTLCSPLLRERSILTMSWVDELLCRLPPISLLVGREGGERESAYDLFKHAYTGT